MYSSKAFTEKDEVTGIPRRWRSAQSNAWRRECSKPQRVAQKLAYPVGFVKEGDLFYRTSCGPKARAALDDAIERFEAYLDRGENARPIREMIATAFATVRKEHLPSYGSLEGYDAYCDGPGTFALRVKLDRPPRKRKSKFESSLEEDDDTLSTLSIDSYTRRGPFATELIDFHLTKDAGKAFEAEVSRWPGCVAERVRLTEEQKLERSIASKGTQSVYKVVISAEAVEARRSGRIQEPPLGTPLNLPPEEESEKKPKRPPGPYMLFCKVKRPKVVAANPEFAFGEVGKKLGEEWKKLSDAEKASYEK